MGTETQVSFPTICSSHTIPSSPGVLERACLTPTPSPPRRHPLRAHSPLPSWTRSPPLRAWGPAHG